MGKSLKAYLDKLSQEGSMIMEDTLIVNLDDQPIRFTPDGKISIVDAIKALSKSDRPQSIWEDLKTEHPEILPHCEDYSFPKDGSTEVVDSEGWELVWIFLPYYLGY
jgi:hypothetical protein